MILRVRHRGKQVTRRLKLWARLTSREEEERGLEIKVSHTATYLIKCAYIMKPQ